MKILTLMILGLMVIGFIGCGKSEVGTKVEAETKTKTETGKTEKKPLSPEEKLIGSYEIKNDGETKEFVLLENGKFEAWTDGEKEEKGTWKFEAKEVHVVIRNDRPVFKIEPNGDLTVIALIEDGKRTDIPKEDQATFKKIK